MRANNDEGREPWPRLAPPLGSRIRAASNSELDTNEVNQWVDMSVESARLAHCVFARVVADALFKSDHDPDSMVGWAGVESGVAGAPGAQATNSSARRTAKLAGSRELIGATVARQSDGNDGNRR